MPAYLGISAFYHDSAAALVRDGEVVFAAAEERFTRHKHDAGFPEQAVRAALAYAGCSLAELDGVIFYEKPLLSFDRILDTWLDHAPHGYAFFAASAPGWLREKLLQKQYLRRRLRGVDPAFRADRLGFSEHHRSHAASAFFPSPFEEAAVLTLDGVGEWATATIQHGRGARLEPLRELRFPHSLGLLYAAFTAYCGFKVNGGEYKLMGLAPYGEPHHVDLILDEMVDLKADGSFQLDLSWFDWCRSLSMTTPRFHRAFGGPPRTHGAPIQAIHRDLAASIQKVTEVIVGRMAAEAHRLTGAANLCLAGGVALNGVANGRLSRESPFEKIWIQPAAGDAGGALGAAWIGYLEHGERSAEAPDLMSTARLGPAFTTEEVLGRLRAMGEEPEVLGEEELVARAAAHLASGRCLAWASGRMEFGPRALGNRSILADPRDLAMRDRLNATVKHREAFRPFAPVVPDEVAAEWFDLDGPSATMGRVVQARQPDRMPAAVHVDGSARVQTLTREVHPRLHAVLHAFGDLTGVPVLVNTSFNVAGEPIVCTPEDAVRCFRGTALDALVVERCWLSRRKERA